MSCNSNPLLGCGCGCGLSTCEVCGEFEEATNPQAGGCAPRRVKISCEAPTLPVGNCDGDIITPIYNPSLNPPYRIQSILFDELCDPITDQFGEAILVITT